MRAITLTQPWCGLMAASIKRIENRSRPIIKREDIGSEIAFHASREINAEAFERIYEIAPELHHSLATTREQTRWHELARITSAVTHVATLVDVLDVPRGREPTGDKRRREFEQALALGTVTEDQWRWYFGQVGYVFKDERVLKTPVLCRGWQGCWTLPGDVEAKVRAQLVEMAA
jgi:hypothetical protein